MVVEVVVDVVVERPSEVLVLVEVVVDVVVS